jgi:hypothetical protein
VTHTRPSRYGLWIVRRRKRPVRTFACPHCGHAVRVGALACPDCGSDAQSGWSEDADAWSGDLPAGYGDDDDDGDGDDDYEDFLRREGLAEDGRPSRDAIQRQRVVVVIVFLVICVLLWQVLR